MPVRDPDVRPHIKIEPARHVLRCNCCTSDDDCKAVAVGWRTESQGSTQSTTMCRACRQQLAAELDRDLGQSAPDGRGEALREHTRRTIGRISDRVWSEDGK